MATEIVREAAPASAIIADRWLYLAEDGSVVDKGDPKGRSLLAAPGSMIEPGIAQRYGLSLKGGKVSQASRKEIVAAAREAGLPADLGTPNEGQIREPGKPLILVPRTGVLRQEPAERVVHKHGDEVEMVARNPADLVPKDAGPKAVSNVPPEDDELRAQVAEETTDEGAQDEAAKEAAKAERASKAAAKEPKVVRRRKGK